MLRGPGVGEHGEHAHRGHPVGDARVGQDVAGPSAGADPQVRPGRPHRGAEPHDPVLPATLQHLPQVGPMGGADGRGWPISRASSSVLLSKWTAVRPIRLDVNEVPS